jgi:hypothetical protein
MLLCVKNYDTPMYCVSKILLDITTCPTWVQFDIFIIESIIFLFKNCWLYKF